MIRTTPYGSIPVREFFAASERKEGVIPIIEIGHDFLPNLALQRGPFYFLKCPFPASEYGGECGTKLNLNLGAQTRSDFLFLSSILGSDVEVTEIMGMFMILKEKPSYPNRRFRMRVSGNAQKLAT